MYEEVIILFIIYNMYKGVYNTIQKLFTKVSPTRDFTMIHDGIYVHIFG